MDAISRADPLEDVLAAERELAELIGAERQKAARWLEARKREIDAEAAAQRARLEEAARERDEQAKKDAAARAAALVEQARATAARMEALDDEHLRPIVLEHVAAGVLP